MAAWSWLKSIVSAPFTGWPFGVVPRADRIESADYTITNNRKVREELMGPYRAMRKQRGFLRWSIFFLVGLIAAGLYRGLFKAIDEIEDRKFEMLQDKISEGDDGSAFLMYFTIMVVLTLGALLIVLLVPLAGGGGVPEVICALNGTREQRLFTFSTLFAKAISLVFAVASGLALGPEGPFIHLGAILGPVTVQGCAWVICTLFPNKFLHGPAQDLLRDVEERNFVVVGAAVGVAVAFRAPIGGVLFVLEEAVSFFDARLIFRVYFSCAVAYYALQIMFQGHHLITHMFTEYDVENLCDVGYLAEDLVLFAIMGCLGGLLGAIFNRIVVRIAEIRQKYVSRYGYRRMLDAAFLCLLTSLLVVFVPINYGCTPIVTLREHIPDSGFAKALALHRNDSLYPTAVVDPDLCLSDVVWDYFRQLPVNSTNVSAAGANMLFGNVTLITTRCAPGEYNQLASLMQTSGHSAVHLLFTSGIYDMFGFGSLAIFFLVYFMLAACTASLSVPAGMVVPSLIIGGTMGRFFALLINLSFKKWVGEAAVDPGSWAMVGAAAFWCGSARITVTIAVIIMEITGDFRFIPAIAVAVMFAKLTGQFLSNSVYHMMIHLKAIPFLEDIPAQALDRALVHELMISTLSSDLVTLPIEATVEEINEKLANCKHNGFPVLRKVNNIERLAGLISRTQVFDAIKSLGAAAYQGGTLVPLCDFMNETPVTVLPTFTLPQAFKIFRALGLRHLPVVDESYQLVGLLTRKCFMAAHIPHKPPADADTSTISGYQTLYDDDGDAETGSQRLLPVTREGDRLPLLGDDKPNGTH